MQFSSSILVALVASAFSVSAQPIVERMAVRPSCGKHEMCQPAAGSTLDQSFDFRYHGSSSNSASSQFISLSLEPVPSSKSRINQTKKKSNLKATQTSPSKFSWKEDHSTYMFAGTAGIPCGTEGEFMVHLDDHVKVNGKMVKESHVFGPYNVTTETCKEATQPQKA